MSTILIEDIAHVRFTAPDLDQMRAFLVEFGLTPIDGEGDVLFARGAGPAPFVHATAKGPPGFAGLGLRAGSIDDLERLAATENVSVQPHAAPGAGMVVRLTDPDGFVVEVVAGQTPANATPLDGEALRNTGRLRARLRQTVRLRRGPSQVLRLGHAVLEVTDFRTSEAWYKERFGFITSDEVEMAPGLAMGAFMRCDLGDALTDHHTLFLLQSPAGARFNHAAFEVADVDDLMRGHTHLKQANHTPAWGVGRHILGSQIFDYWKDPWGHELEHWTDGDLFTAADGSHKATLQDLLGVQWGPLHPMMAQPQGELP